MSKDVRLSADPATLDDVLSIAYGARVELTEDALAVIRDSRRVVDDAVARGEAVYGVTTGLGHARNDYLPAEALVQLQPLFVAMHLGAIGEPLPVEVVRGAMAVRAIGFLRGGAGVSLGLVDGLVGLLNNGITPVVPRLGSVGAGDLSQMAVVGQALLGLGEVEVDGQRLPAGRALTEVGRSPVAMQPKDGLAIVAGNAVSLAGGILVVDRLRRLLGLGDLVVAVTMEATNGNPSIVDPAVAGVRESAGQVATSTAIREALDGSVRTSIEAGLSVQDPLTLRVVPQVHGACRDVVEACAAALHAELNAPSDNPMVDRASGRLISNGNFHPMQVALGFESVRVALGHVGLLAERRMGHLWDAVVAGLDPGAPPPGVEGGAGMPPHFAGLSLRYAAAARYTRLRALAQPVTLDVPVLDLGVEDHAPNTLESVWATDEAADVLEQLLAIELLIAVVGLTDPDVRTGLGRGTADLVDQVHAALADVVPGTPPNDILGLVITRLRDTLS
jgi:histidine ammonia-lyase